MLEGRGNSANSKKERGRSVQEYKGVTLMPTLHTIHIHGGRDKQSGFRKKRRLMDNIYVLNYIVGR